MDKFQLEHTSRQWLLFTALTNVRLRTASLHNGNEVTSVPLVQAVLMTETHEYLHVCCKKYATKNAIGINVLT